MRKADALKVFEEAVGFLNSLGIECPEPDLRSSMGNVARIDDAVVNTAAGKLRISIYLSSYKRGEFGFWIAQRFENPEKAIQTYSYADISRTGKWNFYFSKNPYPEVLWAWKGALRDVTKEDE